MSRKNKTIRYQVEILFLVQTNHEKNKGEKFCFEIISKEKKL